jgi:hypothetical protein
MILPLACVVFGATLNVLDGTHAINAGAQARITFVPLPLAELNVRRGRDALRLEGLPPVAFSYQTGSGVGATTTRLSIGSLVYRRTVGSGFWLGLGETLYNQHTTYAAQSNAVYRRFLPVPGLPLGSVATVYRIVGSEEQYSRVAGPRFEAGRRWARGRSMVEASAALNPAMHGIQYTFIPTGGAGPNPTFADSERATQVDLALRVVRSAGRRAELLYGVRYVNYGGHYDDEPGQLTDRNVGFAPLVGYRMRL